MVINFNHTVCLPEGKTAINIIATIQTILNKFPENSIKTIELTGYIELGEYAGAKPFPLLKVELK